MLVTGAEGQLGRALVACAPSHVECIGTTSRCFNLANEGEMRGQIRRYQPDLLINAAAYTAVDKAEKNISIANLINARAVEVMRDELKKIERRLIQISTDYVFDGFACRPYRPCDVPNPLSVYGRSKAAGEVAAGIDSMIVRSSWVYAAGGSNFVITMLRLMRERVELRVVADQIGAPTWASGLANTIWRLAALNVSGIFHHRDAGVASWYDFAVAIQEEAVTLGLLDKSIPIIPIATSEYPTLAVRPTFSLIDDSSTRQLLADRTEHWRENLRRMLYEEMKLA